MIATASRLAAATAQFWGLPQEAHSAHARNDDQTNRAFEQCTSAMSHITRMSRCKRAPPRLCRRTLCASQHHRN
eukprot:12782596-Alexandrium_andersonii.AAC.1